MDIIYEPFSKEFPIGKETCWMRLEIIRLARHGLKARIATTRDGKREFLEVEVKP